MEVSKITRWIAKGCGLLADFVYFLLKIKPPLSVQDRLFVSMFTDKRGRNLGNENSFT